MKEKNKMQKRLLLFAILFISTLSAVAEDVSFTINVAPSVIKGEQFRLSYVLKNANGTSPKFPNEIEGINILYGPSVSQSQRMQTMNGRTTSESSETYTFVLMADKEGTYTIPAATITAGGKTLTTPTARVKVLPPDKNKQNAQDPFADRKVSSSNSTAANIKPDDAFIRAIVTKTKVYEQEALMISFRLYTTLSITNTGKIEFPEFEGFMVEDVELPVNVGLLLEHYKGRNYWAGDLKKSVIFPQRSGKISIPAGKFELVFSVASGRQVQTFFGPQSIPVDVKKTLTTVPVTIDVMPLPNGKPASFSNAVGSFKLNSKITDTDIKANEAITITLDISGTGDLKLIKNPELILPKDFETYDPKVNNNFTINENGQTGTKSIEYLFIPRHPGAYTIPPVEFSFFDPKTKAYKTLATPEYKLNIAKDPNAGTNSAVSYTNQTEVDAVKDIRFFKTGKADLMPINDFIFGSLAYFLWYIIPIVLFIAFFIVYKKQIKQNADLVLMKTKKANKVAAKRLKNAGKYLSEQNKEKFYEEVLRATWGYLSDKLSIPVADLNRENIELELNKYGVSEGLNNSFREILDTCEFARYSPAESGQAMDKLYDETVKAISQMENIVKKKKGTQQINSFMLVLFMLFISYLANAQQDSTQYSAQEKALKAYQAENYEEAIDILEAEIALLAEKGMESSDLYYNLGNTYFRDNEPAKAILNYERANLIDPGDRDIRHNLEFARTKTEDKIIGVDSFFLQNWFDALQNLQSSNAWTKLSIVVFLVFMATLVVFFFTTRISIKKITFYIGIVSLVVIIVTNVFAFRLKSKVENRNTGIIMTGSVSIKTSPDEYSKELFILHSGTKVKITKEDGNWMEIEIDNGNVGWINKDKLEVI